MSPWKSVFGSTLLCTLASQAWAQGSATRAPYALEGYVSNDAIQALYIRNLDVGPIGATEVAGGVFFNEARDLIAIGTAVSSIGQSEDFKRFRIHAGVRLHGAFLNNEDEDVFGVSVGGDARYILGPNRGTSIVLALFYAPDILVFGSADGIRDASLRFELGLQGSTAVFVGYRVLEFELPVDRRVDDSVHLGFRHTF